MTLTLDQYNKGYALQRQMADSGKHAEFGNVFATALRGDRTALEVFAAWASIHPDLEEAMSFLKEATKDTRGTMAIALGIQSCTV